MAVLTISGLPAGLAADLDDTALFPIRNNDTVDRKYTLAQVRTALGTTTSATAWSIGPNGATNPVWQVDCSTGSQAAGLKVTGATSAGTVAVAVISSGSNANLSIDAKGTGTVTIAGTSTGNVTIGDVFVVANSTGNLTTGTINSQTISATASFTGTLATAGKITVTVTTEQQRWAYDALNYCTITVASDGTTTFDSVDDGSTGAFVFSDPVAATLSTAAQPNITSVGTLTSLSVGAITSTGLIQTTLTTEQMRLRYDASNHLAVTVGSTGGVTYNATGSGAAHTFSDPVTLGSVVSFLFDTGDIFPTSSGANTATMTNAPTAGNPSKWVVIKENATTSYCFPVWLAV